jgi:hypothetical protein
MDISKAPPPGFPAQQPDTAPSKDRLINEIETAVTKDLEELEEAAPASDQPDIRPLDIPGGLQILLAEIRAAFQQIAEFSGLPRTPSASPGFGAAGDNQATDAVQTARQIVELLLQSLPDDAGDAAGWTSALMRSESALQAGLQQAVTTVSTWRGVADVVVDTVAQSGTLVIQALSEETPNPLWLRPEWVGLAPRLERFARRRRAARRRLTDPDHWQGSLDDHEQPR